MSKGSKLESEGGIKCPCCKICKDCTGFQKILELQGSGLVVYRRKNRTDDHDFTKNLDEEDINVQNTKDIKTTQTDLKSAFEQHQLNCAKCQQVMKHAQSLLQNVPSISKNDIINVCDHCRNKLKSLVPCFECEKIVKKFVATMGKVNKYEDTQKKHFMMLLKFQNIVKSLATDKSHLEKGHRRSLSAIIGETEPIFRPEMLRPSTGAGLLAAKTMGEKEKNENITSFTEKAQKTDRLSLQIKETEHFFNRSLSNESLLQTVKLPTSIKAHSLQDISDKLLKSCLLPSHDKEIKIKKEEITETSRRDDSFIRTLVSDAVKEILPKDFRYLFPGDIKTHKETANIYVSSADLIKETEDRLHVVAEETKRKQEELQFAREERKRLAKEEKMRLAEEENKRLVEEEKKQLAEEENKRLAEEEHKRLAQEERKKITEEERKKHLGAENEDVTDFKNKKLNERSGKELADQKSKQFDSDSKRNIQKRIPFLSTSKTTDIAFGKGKEVKQKISEQKVIQKERKLSRDKDDRQREKDEKQPRSKEDEMTFSRDKYEKQDGAKKYDEEKMERQRNNINSMLLTENDYRQRDQEEQLRKEKDDKQRGKDDKLYQEKDEKQREAGKLLKEKDEKQPGKEGKLAKDKDGIQRVTEESIVLKKKEKQKGKEDKYIQGRYEQQELKEDKSTQSKDKKQKDEDGNLSKKKYEKLDEKGGQLPGDKMPKDKDAIHKQKEDKMSKDKHEDSNQKEGKLTKEKDEKLKENKMIGDTAQERDKTNQDKKSKEDEKLKGKAENLESKSATAKEQQQIKQAKADEVFLNALLSKQVKDKENEAKAKKAQYEVSKKAREAAEKALHGGGKAVADDKHAGPEVKDSLSHSNVPGFTSHEDVQHDAKHDKLQNPNRLVIVKELDVEQIILRKPSNHDDFVLIKSKQDDLKKTKKVLTSITEIDLQLYKRHLHTMGTGTGDFLDSSDLEQDIIGLKSQDEEKGDIIIGEKIYRKKRQKAKTNTTEIISPIQFKSEYIAEPLKQDTTPPTVISEHDLPSQKVKPTKVAELEAKGVIRYALSDRTFIDKGWTLLPTEKVVRKMNVYRMRPAHPEFDWFEHNKNRRVMTYDSGERLAEFEDGGRGRWYYRNGRLALDYYDCEESHAKQRFVIYSSGEPDERGRGRPVTALATFDYLGNGVVFDHAGKIRLKYNQSEGVILDRRLGPVSHWKWHSLNDPPVLQQVMIDTQLAHKDSEILQLSENDKVYDKMQPSNEKMLAIEFDNFIKEKSKKLTQKFKPFQIKMKALKINEQFSLKVLDQATIYLIFRDGTTNLKLNLGMILDHQEIVDTDTANVGEVSSNVERMPARSESIAGLQRSVAYAQRVERRRVERERRVARPQPCASADLLAAGAARPRHPHLLAAPSASTTTVTSRCGFRKPSSGNLYYDTRLV